MILMLATILAVGMVVLLTQLGASVKTTDALVKRRHAFYAADGVTRAAVDVAAQRMLSLPPPDLATSADPALLAAYLSAQTALVQSELDAKKAAITPEGFALSQLNISSLGKRSVQVLTNGPFTGMQAQVQPFTISTELGHSDLDRGANISMSAAVQRATISMFQFFAFIDGYAYLYSGPGARIAGRIHANGHVCIGSETGLYVENITAAGNFYLAQSNGCREAVYRAESGMWHPASKEQVYVANSPMTNGIADLTVASKWSQVGVGCTSNSHCAEEYDRDGTTSTDMEAGVWAATALNRWNGQLRDSTLGVPVLRVPITGSPLVQKGRNALHLPEPNNDNSRFLVDPVIPDEPEDVRAQKLAYRADIRILNGTWYKRDAAHPERLGTPIWSDHPGSLSASNEDKWVDGGTVRIGQADLFSSASSVPKRYSYYVTGGGDGTELRHDAPGGPSNPLPHRPVLSYGTLFREVVGGVPVWSPGYYEMGPCGTAAGQTGTTCPTFYNYVDPLITLRWVMRKALTRAELLQATRSGYRDGWGEVGANENAKQQRENLDLGDFARRDFQLFNMLPINFDVAAFAEALQDTSPGELGSHFSSAPFNGVVWIGATWPGQLDGISASAATSGQPSFWPFQGRQADAVGQPWRTGSALAQIVSGKPDRLVPATIPSVASSLTNSPYQQALPFPLCSESGAALTTGTGGIETAGTAAGPAGFQSAACSRYALPANDASAVFARPNIVRVFNGHDLLKPAFPNGLSIATNIGGVVLGDYNMTSTPSSVPESISTSATWRPAMIAADSVTVQSRNWQDSEAPWNVAIAELKPMRNTSPTSYHFQALTGWLVSSDGNRDEFVFAIRIAETWEAANRNIRGSVFIGFNSLFGARFDWNHENAEDWGSQVFAYDYNLDLPANQPPGAPMFEVTATERFRRN